MWNGFSHIDTVLEESIPRFSHVKYRMSSSSLIGYVPVQFPDDDPFFSFLFCRANAIPQSRFQVIIFFLAEFGLFYTRISVTHDRIKSVSDGGIFFLFLFGVLNVMRVGSMIWGLVAYLLWYYHGYHG